MLNAFEFAKDAMPIVFKLIQKPKMMEHEALMHMALCRLIQNVSTRLSKYIEDNNDDRDEDPGDAGGGEESVVGPEKH